MLMPVSKSMTLLWADIQKPRGSSDCGLFAIATSLCFGELPQDCEWRQEEMRVHLSKCKEAGNISPFPKFNADRNHELYTSSEEIELFCHCRQPHINNVFMIQCEKCLGWFHRGCEKVPENVTRNTLFLCKNCQ